MRIFLSELLCSGAWDAPVDHALFGEGRAMLLALAQDLGQAGYEIVTTWDARLGSCPIDGTVFVVSEADEESHRFAAACAAAEAAYIIAPEIDRQLTLRCRAAAGLSCPPLNATEEALDLCGDKLTLFHWAQEHELQTIPTELLADRQFSSYPLIVKPRDGAGATDTFVVRSETDMRQRAADLEPQRFIVQPFIDGEAVSVAAVFDRNGALQHILPQCRQTIDVAADGQVSYSGGRVEVGASFGLEQTVNSLADHIAGLHGYIGFDYLIPAEGPPILVEINPRLTTSYLGYRACCSSNLASAVVGLADEFGVRSWKSCDVEYHCDGSVVVREPSTCENA